MLFYTHFLKKFLIVSCFRSDYFCHECCAIFSNREHLNEHKKEFKHHRMIRKFGTDNNAKTRKKKKIKKKHRCQHDELEPLNRHKMRHLGKKNVGMAVNRNKKSDICCFCKISFCDSDALRKHKKFIQFQGVQCRSFVCRKCNKSFARKYCLQTHWKVHTQNEKIYRCKDCDSSFSSKSNYSKHQRVYH